ncbi:MAG: histidinol dehydrogenase [Prochloraceae cyanobacterium]
MLRIITEQAEAKTELRRLGERTHDEEIRAKELVVREILETVKRQGNQALLDYAQKLDGQTLTIESLRVSGSELDAAYQQISKELLDAIQLACGKIEAFHQKRIPKSWVQFEEDDVVLGKRYTPVDTAGIYLPGGRASYPSTVLIHAIPAKIAKVPRIIMIASPGPEQKINPGVLVAAQEAGVEEIYRVGGAQAIAALAYGTETIPKVDTIVGSGNIYVTLAKKLLYGTVNIDFLAGPSELLIVADSQSNPLHVAADLLAQAEREPMAAAILVTTDASLAEKVRREVEQQLQNHPRRVPTEKALAHYGLIIVVDSLEEAAELSNLFAPEHLELEVVDPWEILEKIKHAGTIFLGNFTPEAVGNYLTGTKHTLPTARTTRYTSALGVETFMKHSSLIQYSPAALKKVSSAIQILAQAEGLPSQVNSVRLRTQAKQLDD